MDTRSTIFGLAGSGLMAFVTWGQASLVVGIIGTLVIAFFLAMLLYNVNQLQNQAKGLGTKMTELHNKVDDIQRAVKRDE